MANEVKNSITVVNTFTGEVTQFDYANIDQLKSAYLELESYAKTIDRAMKKMKADLEHALGNDDRIDFGDGWALKRFNRSTYEYRKEVVGKYLDPDQLDVVTKIDGVALKTLLKELNTDPATALPNGAWADIEQSAHAKHSEYVRLIKSA